MDASAGKIHGKVANMSQSQEDDQALHETTPRYRSSTEGIDPSLEMLVRELMQHNAALQQELLEIRTGSSSGSNESQKSRSEGRGARRLQTDGGLARKGKGIGSEGMYSSSEEDSGRRFLPPWTSFAAPSETSPAMRPAESSLGPSSGPSSLQPVQAGYLQPHAAMQGTVSVRNWPCYEPLEVQSTR